VVPLVEYTNGYFFMPPGGKMLQDKNCIVETLYFYNEYNWCFGGIHNLLII